MRTQSVAPGAEPEGRRRFFELLTRHGTAFSLAGLFLAYFATRLLFLGKLPVFFDESIYIRWSQQVLHDGRYLISLTDGKPPLHIWIMVPFLMVVKDPLLAGRLASVACGAATLTGIILIGKELEDLRLGLWGGAFYVVCTFTLWYDRVALSEGLLLALSVYTVYSALRCAKTLRLSLVPVIAVLLGMALLTKGTAQLLYLISPLAFLTRPLKRRALKHDLLRWAALMCASLVGGYAIYSVLRFSALYRMIGLRTAATTRSLGEILKNPFDVFLSNLQAILSTLIIFMSGILLAAAVCGLALGFARKWRPAWFLAGWVAVVALVESLVAKHWMFDTILPRFFLSLAPPLLLSAAYASRLLAVRSGLATGMKRTLYWKGAALAVLALLVLVPLAGSVWAIADPSSAPLPQWIRFQYVTDWPSGWGIAEAVDLVKREGGPVLVGSNLKGIGLPTDGLLMYLFDDPDVVVLPFSYKSEKLPRELLEAARRKRTLLVFNAFPGRERPPGEWPVRMLEKIPKDGNPGCNLYIMEVVP